MYDNISLNSSQNEKSFKSCKENQNTHFTFNNDNRAICEGMSKNMVQPDRPQMTIQP